MPPQRKRMVEFSQCSCQQFLLSVLLLCSLASLRFLFDSSAHVVPATGRSRLRDRVSDRRCRIKHASDDWRRVFIGGDSAVRADRAIEGAFLCSTSKHAAHSWEVTFGLSCLCLLSAACESGPLVYSCVRFHKDKCATRQCHLLVRSSVRDLCNVSKIPACRASLCSLCLCNVAISRSSF